MQAIRGQKEATLNASYSFLLEAKDTTTQLEPAFGLVRWVILILERRAMAGWAV